MNRTRSRPPRAMNRALLTAAVLMATTAVFGQTIRPTYIFMRQFDASSLDPIAIDSPWTQSPIENLYEGLYRYAAAGTDFMPVLATAHQLSEDGRAHTFYLRRGVTFHSGNPFTCKDAAYSLQRALIAAPNRVTESILGPAAVVLSEPGSLHTDADYAAAWRALDDGVRCANAHTLVVTSMASDPVLFTALMNPTYFVVDSAYAAAHGDWDGTAATWRSLIGAAPNTGYLHDHVSGTGAFKLVSWQAGVHLVAERNHEYWGDDPHLEAVVYLVVADEATRVAALLAGEADQIDLRVTSLSELRSQPGVKVLELAQESALPGEAALASAGAPFVLLPSFSHAIVTTDEVTGAYRNPLFAEVRWADLRKPAHLGLRDDST